jgi:hypothetical protein
LGLISTERTFRRIEQSPIAVGEAFVGKLKEATEVAQAAIAIAQERQEHYANQNRQPAERFRVGDKVWLRLKNIRTDRPSKNLDWLNAKYSVIEVIDSHNWWLDTPPGIHDVFHISLIRRAAQGPLPSQRKDDDQPAAALQYDNPDQNE